MTMSNVRRRDEPAARTIRLTVAYEGTHYAGWQVQPDQPSVQAAVEQAIQKLTGESVRVHGAGRTDARVHATGQTAHFTTRSSIPADRFAAALNTALPRDIVVLDSREATSDFHARYAAVRKQYRYLIETAPHCLPWLRHLVWHLPGPFDVQALDTAGQLLVGRHDFSSFESKSDPEEDSVRTVLELQARRCGSSLPWCDVVDLVAIDITADGFLYNMVRSIVGTLVKVARGEWSAADIKRVLDSRDRSQAGPTAPPQGLFLVRVDYGEGRELRVEC